MGVRKLLPRVESGGEQNDEYGRQEAQPIAPKAKGCLIRVVQAEIAMAVKKINPGKAYRENSQ